MPGLLQQCRMAGKHVIRGQISGANSTIGHLLRDPAVTGRKPDEIIETGTLVVGGGDSALDWVIEFAGKARNYTERLDSQVNLPKMQAGGLDAAFFIVYVGEPDSVDQRPVLKVRLDPNELATKRRMLGAFVSQNAPSLVATRSYPDRLTVHRPPRYRRYPFDFASSYLRLALALRRRLPASIVDRLLPVQLGTIGRMGSITDWDAERGASGR